MLQNAPKIKIVNIVDWRWEQDEFSFLNSPRSCYGLLTVVKGRIDYIIGDKTISLKEGSFVYLPKNSLYKARFYINESEVKTILVNFDLEDADSLPLPPFYNSQDKTLQFETALKRLCDLKDEDEAVYLKQAYLNLCLHIIYTDYIHNSQLVDTELIAKAKSMLIAGEMSVEQIAEELKISSSGFRKKFKEATGFSPSDFRISARIEQAKRLLLTTDLSIDAVAEQTGFYDTPYFYKKFYSLVGTTPKKYRKNEIVF